MKKALFKLILLLSMALCLCLFGCAKKEVEKPAAPTNVRMEVFTLVWDEVPGASWYLVTVDETPNVVYECKLDLYNVSAGDHIIEVKTIVEDGGKNNSSEPVIYNYNALPREGYDEKGFHFKILKDGSGYEITQGNADMTGDVVLPDYYSGLPVKAIPDKESFSLKSYLFVHVNIFDEYNCNTITTSLKLPAHLKKIGTKAFYGTLLLKEIVIPDSVTEIGSAAFGGCKRLTKITLPAGLKHIYGGAFGLCALNELSLPSTLETIGAGAFSPYQEEWYQTNQPLSKVVIPDSVKTIEEGAFYGNHNLSEIVLPDNLDGLKIFKNPFENTAWYDAQPDGLVYYRDYLLGYKGEMPNGYVMNVPNGVKYIAERAFLNKKNKKERLTEVYLPDGIKYMGDAAFSFCSSLTKVRLPSDMKVIPNQIFSSCSKLKEVQIPRGVVDIGYYAFNETALASVILPDSLEKIGIRSFLNCKELEKVVLPSNLKTIEEGAFFGCSKLKSIVIPKSVESLGELPFTNCTMLTHIYYDGDKEQWEEVKTGAYDKKRPQAKPFSNAGIYIYAEEKPTETGLFWHYVDGVPTVWK